MPRDMMSISIAPSLPPKDPPTKTSRAVRSAIRTAVFRVFIVMSLPNDNRIKVKVYYFMIYT